MEADVIIKTEIIAAYFNTFATPMLEGKQVDTSSFHGNISDWRLKGTIVWYEMFGKKCLLPFQSFQNNMMWYHEKWMLRGV